MDHNQQSNTPPPNQQNTPPPSQNMAGFGPFSRLLHEGMIPNQPQFSPMTQSPPIPFNQIQHNYSNQNAYFSQNFNDPRTFLQPEFQQPNFYGGGGSGQARQEEEVVPETQPEPTQKKKRAPRKKATSEPQGDKMPWSDDELVALADAWCTTSQNEIRGNDQKKDGYWGLIRVRFAATLGKPENYRSTDGLTSKWTDMKAKLTKFNGIYMRLARNPPSGWNELKLLDEAHNLYKSENRQHPFTLKRVWDRVRCERKWLELPSSTSRSSGSKRSFVDIDNSMGSDAHVNVNLNEETGAIPLDDDDDEDDASLHSRPPRGRDKAKRIQKFGDMSEAKARHREKVEKCIDTYAASVEEKKARREELRARQEDLINQQQILTHLSIMTTGGVKDDDVEFVDEVKKESKNWLKKWFKK